MKPALRVIALALGAALLEAIVLYVATATGIGPWGRSMQLVMSGAMDTYSEASSRAWFAAAEQGITLERYVLWPTIFLLTSLAYVRYVPIPRWWHAAVIAGATLPLALPSYGVRWLPELAAYTLFVFVLSALIRRFIALRASAAAA